jgi:hypothetical protein
LVHQRAEARMNHLPPIIYDPRHWRDRAEEARRMADQIQDHAARHAMLQVAAGYERLAERASARKPEPAA